MASSASPILGFEIQQQGPCCPQKQHQAQQQGKQHSAWLALPAPKWSEERLYFESAHLWAQHAASQKMHRKSDHHSDAQKDRRTSHLWSQAQQRYLQSAQISAA
eukprot:CAMPEP_0180512206 /NCGR_PEP_ID=MMETSP1036_2-20121128/51456_1 /TAXON_ID=632150 /ORGANISM="Azadinium spinosum, Strain 3D9" /LENGTH=103 /DNA_ID=CAMNT_0022523313 /DNA_START=300 /DNA_END=607 /DNA_ORIENTATION=-